MQMSEGSRQIIYGTVIIAMLLAYSRNAKTIEEKRAEKEESPTT